MNLCPAATLMLTTLGLAPALGADAPPLVRSVANGAWSNPATWERSRVPAAGERVQIRGGHVVRYDSRIDAPIRSIHVAGTLTFEPDRDTLLTVGLIKVQAGDDACESGFECEAPNATGEPPRRRAAFEVGTARRPISAEHRAVIRLAPVAGLDPEECPALLCCGGRMDLHGAPVSRT
jgi:hypothetical protein